MKSFAEIRARAEERYGADEIARRIDPAVTGEKPPNEIAEISDDRILSEITKRIFQAGFSWTVIENKWPGFEAAFDLRPDYVMPDGFLTTTAGDVWYNTTLTWSSGLPTDGWQSFNQGGIVQAATPTTVAVQHYNYYC